MHLIIKRKVMIFLIKKQYILKKSKTEFFKNKTGSDMTVRYQKTFPHLGSLISLAMAKCSDISI